MSPETYHCQFLQAEQSQDKGEGTSGHSNVDDTAAATEAEDGFQDIDISATLQQVPAYNCDLSVAATPTFPSIHSPKHQYNPYPQLPTYPCLFA